MPPKSSKRPTSSNNTKALHKDSDKEDTTEASLAGAAAATMKDTTPAAAGTNSSSGSKINSKKRDTKSTKTTDTFLYDAVWVGVLGYALFLSLQASYKIRLQAIEEYGPIIHEFDPYFNYRATEVRTDLQKCRQIDRPIFTHDITLQRHMEERSCCC
jgi:hypothetical protein